MKKQLLNILKIISESWRVLGTDNDAGHSMKRISTFNMVPIKLCPHCGATGRIERYARSPVKPVRCWSCGSMSPDIETWNRRDGEK